MMTLDQALKEAADRIDGRVTAKTKIAPLNFNSPHDKFSSYVLDEVTANLVDSGKLTVVDRKEVDLIRSEFNFQLSGEVGDDSMQQLGRMLGAQSIISGSLTDMGGFYRIVIRVLNVQNASVEVQYRANIVNDTIMAALLTGGKTAAVTGTPQRASSGGGTAAQTPVASVSSAPEAIPSQPAPAPAQPVPAQSTAPAPGQPAPGNNQGSAIQGTTVPGNNLAAKLAWLNTNAQSNTAYILELSANEDIRPQTLSYTNKSNVTVVLRGIGANRNINLLSSGNLFTVENEVILVLDNNITLRGRGNNDRALVFVNKDGTLIMNAGSTVTGNTASDNFGGGVYVKGTFTMNGGTISGNTSSNRNGGGVYLSGSLTMNGGTITGNTAHQSGGGVYLSEGTFTMRNGTISDNNAASGDGGGVFVYGDRRTFTMIGGVITGNTASRGGGVHLDGSYPGGTFNMRGGTISGNTASTYGGGVYVGLSSFTKSGGTITGYSDEAGNGNVAMAGVAQGDRGHAVYVNNNRRKETTAGPGVNLDSGTAAGWDR